MTKVMVAFLIALVGSISYADYRLVKGGEEQAVLEKIAKVLYSKFHNYTSNCFMTNDKAIGFFYEQGGVQLSRDFFLAKTPESTWENRVFVDDQLNQVLVRQTFVFRSNDLEVKMEGNELLKAVSMKMNSHTTKSWTVGCQLE